MKRFWTAIALCHTAIIEDELLRTETNITPTILNTNTNDSSSEFSSALSTDDDNDNDNNVNDDVKRKIRKYQATSPDEIALVNAAASIGLEFLGRCQDNNNNNNTTTTKTKLSSITNLVTVREQIDLSSKPIEKQYEILAINEVI